MEERPTIINGIPVPYDVGTQELKQIIERSDVNRWSAFIALGYKMTQESLDLLVHYLHAKDAYVRRAALEAISYHANAGSVTKDILACFEDSSPYVVRTACQTVKCLKLAVAHNQIVKLVSDSSDQTRQVAINTISELWQPGDFGLVFRIFKTDSSEAVKKEAAWTLFANATDENWNELFNLWIADNLSRYRVWACLLAARFGTPDILRKLEILSTDTDGHVRNVAQLAIKQLTSPLTN